FFSNSVRFLLFSPSLIDLTYLLQFAWVKGNKKGHKKTTPYGAWVKPISSQPWFYYGQVESKSVQLSGLICILILLLDSLISNLYPNSLSVKIGPTLWYCTSFISNKLNISE